MPSNYVEDFLGKIPKLTADPLTKCLPKSEVELTAALVRLNTRGLIRWHEVEFHSVAGPRSAKAFALINNDAGSDESHLREMLCPSAETFAEYPMCFDDIKGANRWGGMRADAVIVPRNETAVVLVEAKVDSHFTYGNRPPEGQLSRQIDYLERLDRKAALLMICPEFNVSWYSERLRDAFDASKKKVVIGVASWEGIFRCAN